MPISTKIHKCLTSF